MATPRRSAPCLHGVLWTVSVLDQRYHTRYHKSFLHEWKRTGGWSGLLLLVGWCWFVSWLVSRLKVPWILTSCKLLIGMGGRACDPIHHSMVSLQHLQHQRHLNSHGSFQWMAFQVVPFGKWVASFPFFPILSVVLWTDLRYFWIFLSLDALRLLIKSWESWAVELDFPFIDVMLQQKARSHHDNNHGLPKTRGHGKRFTIQLPNSSGWDWELYGTIWNFMKSYGTLWHCMELYGILWNYHCEAASRESSPRSAPQVVDIFGSHGSIWVVESLMDHRTAVRVIKYQDIPG